MIGVVVKYDGMYWAVGSEYPDNMVEICRDGFCTVVSKSAVEYVDLVQFTEHPSTSGGKVITAVLGGEPIGKHYTESGLSWNMPTRIRYQASEEEWRANVKEGKIIT